MRGVDAATGRELTGTDHLAQSLRDIMATRKGTRVMRRDYGSDVPDLIDAPLNGLTLLRFYAAVAAAVRAWEPRVRLDRVRIVATSDEKVTLEISGTWTDRAADAGAVIDGAGLQAGAAEVTL